MDKAKIEQIIDSFIDAKYDVSAFGKGDWTNKRNEHIGLVDILQLIQINRPNQIEVDTTGYFWKGYRSTGATWNLKHDSLTSQSKECIEFLVEILGN